MARNYYELLGVARDASDKDIRRAFRRLARKHHPDVNPGDKAAEERFKEINRAHEVLSNQESRAKYDRYGDKWEQAEAFEKARQQAGAQGSYSSQSFDLGDLFRDGGGLGDVFGGIFSGRRRAGPSRGQNLEQPVEITLEEAFQGASRVLAMQTQEACPTCVGSGRIGGAVCHVCQGAGVSLRPKRLEVRIPGGVRTGSRVRITGEGLPGAGGPRGDLNLVVSVRPHRRFERKGDDLYTTVKAPLEDAVLGGECEVQTISGKRVMLSIPPLTQNGRVFRLAGKGMPHLEGGGHGDLHAKVEVVLPEKLSDEERALFERLRESRKQKVGSN